MYVYINMYVCVYDFVCDRGTQINMYVCVYACNLVCAYICKYVCILCMYGGVLVLLFPYENGCMLSVCLCVCVCVYMHMRGVCIYVHTYAHILIYFFYVLSTLQKWLEALTELKVLSDDVGCDVLLLQREKEQREQVFNLYV
jgi:hypothetical protein